MLDITYILCLLVSLFSIFKEKGDILVFQPPSRWFCGQKQQVEKQRRNGKRNFAQMGGREGSVCPFPRKRDANYPRPGTFYVRTYIRFTTDGQLVLLFDDSRGDCRGRPPTVEKQWQKKRGDQPKIQSRKSKPHSPTF